MRRSTSVVFSGILAIVNSKVSKSAGDGFEFPVINNTPLSVGPYNGNQWKIERMLFDCFNSINFNNLYPK